MTPVLTERERRQFDELGFLIFDDVLTRDELQVLNRDADRLYARYGGDAANHGRLEVRNCVAHSSAFLRIVDHPALLPKVVELMGPDIKIRTSELDIRPALASGVAREEVGEHRWGQPERWHIDGPLYGYPSVNGIVPMMEVRAGYYLTDVRGRDTGQLCLVPGSHKVDYNMLADPKLSIPPRAVMRVNVRPGSAVLFRTGVWHCASANRSGRTRKVLYFAYTYRWIHGSDYLQQDPRLLKRCSPIQRQLLGGSASPDRHPLGREPEKTPCSLFWFTEPRDIPVLAAAQNGWGHVGSRARRAPRAQSSQRSLRRPRS